MSPRPSSSTRRDQGTMEGGPPVKVRIIVTKFVEVDAREFKSAVQHLTGKNSVVAEAVVEDRRGLACQFGTTPAADRGQAGRKRPLELVSGYEQEPLQREEEEEDAELIALDELFELLRE